MAPLSDAARKVESLVEIIPPARMTQFDQVEPGELFLYLDRSAQILRAQDAATERRHPEPRW